MVNWTRHAKRQLRRICKYIAKDSPFYAKKVSESIVKKTLYLDKLPRQGRKSPELNKDTVRELGIYSYRIIYEIKPKNDIQILTILHKRQKVESEHILRPQPIQKLKISIAKYTPL